MSVRVMHGNGTLTFADKRKFTGSFKDGKIDGDGVCLARWEKIWSVFWSTRRGRDPC